MTDATMPIEWVDKIFKKLTLNYGTDFMARYRGQKTADVKTDWLHEIGPFVKRPAAIAYALQNLPDRVPTAQQFRALCGQAPHNERPEQLTYEHKPNPEIAARVLSGLSQNVPRVDHKAWAKAILVDVKGGLKRSPTVVRMAKNALGID